MKSIILLCIASILIQSCHLNEENRKEEKKNNVKEAPSKIASELVSKYGIKYNLDTLDLSRYKYSIDFKPIVNSKYQLLENIEIIDIYEKDSINYVTIKSGFLPAIYFDFRITKQQESKLINKNTSTILVVSLTSIRKIKFTLVGETEDNEGTTSINLNNDFNDFIGKGELIDVIEINKSAQ